MGQVEVLKSLIKKPNTSSNLSKELGVRRGNVQRCLKSLMIWERVFKLVFYHKGTNYYLYFPINHVFNDFWVEKNNNKISIFYESEEGIVHKWNFNKQKWIVTNHEKKTELVVWEIKKFKKLFKKWRDALLGRII